MRCSGRFRRNTARPSPLEIEMMDRDVTRASRLVFAAAVLVLIAAAMPPGAQQVPGADQACIVAFNKSLWKVGRARADGLEVCLREFANGNPIASDLES